MQYGTLCSDPTDDINVEKIIAIMERPRNAPTRLRQIALVAKDLKKAEDLFTTVLGTEVVFVDPEVSRWGLRNILVAIDGDIIEVVSPFKDGTTGGRLLQKRGDGGYMIIMQTLDAMRRRKYIESNGLANVIFSHDHEEVTCVQYHPRGIAGGMMPELDSHTPTSDNPTPLVTPYSPWHACGKDYGTYSAGMKRCSHLKLMNVTCRLADGESDTQEAAKQWERLFGVDYRQDQLLFTNARLKFVPGKSGMSDGLESITIGVRGEQKYHEICNNARKSNLLEGDCISMLGVKWYIILLEQDSETSKL